MSRKIIITSLTLLCAVLVMLATAFWARQGLVRLVANRLLADQQFVLTRLQGLQLDSRHITVANLELQLPGGLQLALSGLELTYSFTSLTTAPVVEALAIESAQLLREPAAGAAMPLQDNKATTGDALLLGDLLQLLREFPVATILVSELTVPQRREVLVLNLQHRAGELNLQLDSGALHLRAGFTQADAAAAAMLRIILIRSEETVGNIELLLQPAAAAYDLTGTGHLEFTDLPLLTSMTALLGELQQETPATILDTARLDWDVAGAVANDVLGTAGDATPATFVLGLQQGSTFTLPAGLGSGLGEFAVVFSDRAEFTITTGAQARVSAGSLPLQVSGSWQQQAVNVDSVLTLRECRFPINAGCSIGFDGSARLAGYMLAGKVTLAASAVADDSTLAGEYRIQTEGLALGGLPTWLPAFDIDARLALEQNQLSFNTPLLLQNAPAAAGMTTAGSYDLATGIANMHVSLPPLEFMEGQSLSALMGELPYPFDLLTGSLAAEVELNWQPGTAAGTDTDPEPGVMTSKLTTTLKDLAGYYGDYFFRGLNTELEASIAYIASIESIESPAVFTLESPPLTLSISSIDVGVPIDNVALAFRFEQSTRRLLIASMSGETLGGTITGEDLVFDFNRERNDITLQFTGLQLERMLALANYDGVAASGAVSGELPLTLTAQGVEVTAGTLHAEAPGGSIRYLAGATAGVGGNAGMDLVNQALGNYQFESLLSSIDYDADGELLLTMQLQGHNPDMDASQPINLNLTLSDNIPALLKSLQAARAIEDFLEEQYR